MAGKKPTAADIPPERLAEIKAAAHSGTNWAQKKGYGPACRCGVPRKVGTIGHSGIDTGDCKRHPEESNAGLSSSE